MKIVIISGDSGSGKSTFAEILGQNLTNAKHVEVDKFIWDKMIADHMDWIKKEFGENVKHIGHMEEQDIEKTKKFIRLILSPTNDFLEHEIMQAQKDGHEYFILDWAFTRNLTLSKNAHYHISLSCDTQTRHLLLHERMKIRFGEVSESRVVNRDLILNEFSDAKQPIDYTVYNDYCRNTFYDEAFKIATAIKSLKIIHKRFSPVDTKCTICSCYLNKDNEDKFISDTILYETDHFILIPPYHGFVPGYALIAPKKCVSSVSYMNQVEYDELKCLMEINTKFLIHKFGFHPAIWEHGLPLSSKTGTYHDHIHFLPTRLIDVNNYVKKLGLTSFTEINDLPRMGKDKDFLYIQDNEGIMYFGETNKNKKEDFKLWLAASLGDPDIIYKPLNEFENNIKETIEIWKDVSSFFPTKNNNL